MDPSGKLSLAAVCLIAGVAAIALVIITLAATLLSGGADIPLVLTAIAIYLNGGLTVAELTIYGAFLTACVGAVITEIVTEAITTNGIL